MRYLTLEECARFGAKNPKDEVTPIELDAYGNVLVVQTHSQGAAYRTYSQHKHGSVVYGRLVAAIDERAV